MLSQLKLIKTLKGNFSFLEAVKLFKTLKNEKEEVYLPKKKRTLYFRKDTKDFETFEEVFVSKIYDVFLTFEPKTIIDAGANTGFASLFFKIKYPNANIVALEINKDNATMIAKNLKGFDNVDILERGLFSEYAYFKVENPYNATNSFVIKKVDKNDDFDIESITIDQILELKQWDTIDILKIDIEGSEKELFETNYQSWLPKVKVIYIETHDRMIPKCAFTVINTINKFDDFILYTTTDGTLIFFNKALISLP
ncbi:FkbM family methyltransferase [Olleya aquimaris]|uniref:FkbM family methyltransferase n=1 Tax=Olleya aquimaris TaxID=639310 RepID=A0A327RAG8_9FLAO|nr:FkbM family methyltransferase [Olleya aquimaris]RAJ13168.1 FkbM family methyltransferase [Olleya aquimaris]